MGDMLRAIPARNPHQLSMYSGLLVNICWFGTAMRVLSTEVLFRYLPAISRLLCRITSESEGDWKRTKRREIFHACLYDVTRLVEEIIEIGRLVDLYRRTD